MATPTDKPGVIGNLLGDRVLIGGGGMTHTPPRRWASDD